METRKIVLHETGIIAIGECIGVAAMFAIFALLGRFDRSVVLGGLIGAVFDNPEFLFDGGKCQQRSGQSGQSRCKKRQSYASVFVCWQTCHDFRHPLCMRKKRSVQCICDCDSASFCKTYDYNS